VNARPDDYLVLRVARDSPFGQGGLRPLDTIPRESIDVVVTWTGTAGLPTRSSDGTWRTTRVTMPEAPADFWVPFLLSYQRDGTRAHLGLGPLDAIFHYSRSEEYNPDTDSHSVKRRWSFLTVIQWTGAETAGKRERSFEIEPFADNARLEYAAEWGRSGTHGRD
jgi:hypothetical protein